MGLGVSAICSMGLQVCRERSQKSFAGVTRHRGLGRFCTAGFSVDIYIYIHTYYVEHIRYRCTCLVGHVSRFSPQPVRSILMK